jgi:hypothetical protein
MSDVSGRLWEQPSKIKQDAVVDKAELQVEIQRLQQENDVEQIYQGEMFKESQKSKEYPERKTNKSREIKFKRRMQKWLKIYDKLKKRAERKVNKNRKIKFRRQLQAWLGVNCNQKSELK